MAVKNGYQNKIQDKRLDNMEKHLEIANKELGHVQIDMAQVKNDTAWLKKFFFIVAASSIGGLIATVMSLIKQ